MNNLIDDPGYDAVEKKLRKKLAGLRKLYRVPEEK